jgi:ubiquinol-cytochrome c reductase cytochrome c1 subunit
MRILAPATLALAAAVLAAAPAVAPAVAQEAHYSAQKWSFDGPFGTFDRAAAQRGFQVYREVCSNCHSLKQAYYRDLRGIGISDADIVTIAASVTVPTLTDDGQPAERPALPSDHFRLPYPNDLAARAGNNGALPPDLSVIVKARTGGPDYVDGILTGFADPPEGFKLGDGMNYNTTFPGNQIAMPQPLQDDQVTYADGTKATIEQEAHDVVTFLTFVANPEMETRKRAGVKIVLFLLLLTGVTYAVKRQVWADVDH